MRAGGVQDPGKQLGQGSANGEEENVLEADLPTFTVLPRASPAFNFPRNKPVSKPDKGCLVFARVCKSPCGCGRPFALHVTSPLRCKMPQAWVGAAVRQLRALCVIQSNGGPFPAEFQRPHHLGNSAHS